MNPIFGTSVQFASSAEEFAKFDGTTIGKLFADLQLVTNSQYTQLETGASLQPQLFVITPRLRNDQPIVGIVPLYYGDADEKEFVMRVYIPSVLTYHSAIGAATITEAWMVSLEKEQITSNWREKINAMQRPSQHPDRIEIVMLQVFDNVGNILEAVARIERAENQPPKLDEWTRRVVIAGNSKNESTGQSVDPIRDTLKLIRESTTGGRG
jgi:hypothetical protein